MKQEDVERIAAEYIKSLELAPTEIDGSQFYPDEDPPIWRVFGSFCEQSEEWIGLPHSLVIDVNDATGEASHIPSL